MTIYGRPCKRVLTAHPRLLLYRIYILSREISNWLQFSATNVRIVLRGLIAILKYGTCMLLDRRMGALRAARAYGAALVPLCFRRNVSMTT